MAKVLRILVLATLPVVLQGCAALWVADKTVETAWFATKTTAKVGMTAAEVTWDAGAAAVDAASGGEETPENDKPGSSETGEPDDG